MSEEQKEEEIQLNLIKFPKAKKGTEITYQQLKSQYPLYKGYIQKNLERVKLDFTDSTISQEIANHVIEDLFSQEKGICKNLIKNVERLKINAFNTQLSNLNFLLHFSDLNKKPPITIHCDYNLATNFLKKSIQFQCDIKCKGHFDKRDNLYYIYCPHILLDSSASIELNIIELSLRVNNENVQNCIDCIKKLRILQTLNLEIHSLNHIKEDYMHIVETLSQIEKLQTLNVKFFLETYLPHINKSKLKNLRQLKYNYQAYDKNENMEVALKLLHTFQQHDDDLIIEPYYSLQNSEINFSFQKRMLTDHEFQVIQSFLLNLENRIVKISINFDENQHMSLKNWVGMMNNLRNHDNLQTINVQCPNIATSVSALCVAKLYKCRKAYIKINQSSFIGNVLNLYFYQMYDHILEVITKNLFELKEAKDEFQIQTVILQANSILGLKKGFSSFFKKTEKLFNSISVKVYSKFDLHLYYYTVLKDISEIQKYCETFYFEQESCINLRYNAAQISSVMSSIYNYIPIIDSLQIPNPSLIKPFLSLSLNYCSGVNLGSNFSQFLEAYQVFMEFRKLVQLKYYQQSQPSVMLAFYTLIGPELPINPYQVYTDLYFE
ncbi:hypothetical protein TTHERM_00938960 (macronuclear) [Tetrahymena thermophila SB210]|uniref:Uncharacterized protein n=1 Tax=Tetrahymena thermophila (strain SB210) TaxID=312017 RepID=Q22DP6_TETTS|nr:hypothetical protein TTHERM_00938960 [Tetrahymena thermophila SB210]EAR83408.1 hypothetical protein TTHERM_00938960 [Tetrahymena thermophila SB210]|eukprot:XP_001031071.1 hypothetical protein TTHERM_00938960 [Tetrahymena thermophila SB210]